MSCLFQLPTDCQPRVSATETWDGWTARLSSTGDAFAGTLTDVELVFKASGSTTAALTLESPDDITIINAAPNQWEWRVLPRTPIGLSAGTYSWEMSVTDNDGRKKIYHRGTIEIDG